MEVRKSNSLELIRNIYYLKYCDEGLGKSSWLWSWWRREAMSKVERIRHLLVWIEARAGKATKNGKCVLRERYRRVLSILRIEEKQEENLLRKYPKFRIVKNILPEN